jgi:histidinol-phosphate aminotransferase
VKVQSLIDNMADALPKPCAHLAALAPYDAVSSLDTIAALEPGVVPLKLDWNESTIPPSPRVHETIAEFLGNVHHLNWYPDLGAATLRTAISGYTGVPAENVIATNGSDDALDLICRTYLDPGDDVIVAWPTYGHFMVFARARGVEPRVACAADLFEPTTRVILGMVTDRTKLVYIASPNNPTGVVTPPEDVVRMCEAFPGTLFLIDEAYFEFSGVSSVPLVGRYPNVIVTRTFSKCFGIAGLRVGYLMASDPVLLQLRKLYNPKSVNVLGQRAAIAALSDREVRENFVAEVRASREYLAKELVARGADARATAANFVCVKVGDPRGLVKALETVGVFVRDRSSIRGFEGYVRITVGTVDQMRDLVGRIDRLLALQPDLLS